jgi:putative ABC transport system ATP-binding protein
MNSTPQEQPTAARPATTSDVIEHARPSTAASIIALRGVRKTYFRGKEPIHVLSDLDLDVPVGGYEALMGPSGSGKSTLLNLIAGLDRPSAGSLRVAGADLGALSDSQLARWRSNTIGFIFQAYNLMPVLTAV